MKPFYLSKNIGARKATAICVGISFLWFFYPLDSLWKMFRINCDGAREAGCFPPAPCLAWRTSSNMLAFIQRGWSAKAKI